MGKWTSAYNWQKKKRQEKKDDAETFERNRNTFWQVIDVCKIYKASAPVVACTYGDGHNIKLNSTAVEYLSDVNRLTNSVTTDLEYRVWIGLIEHGEVQVQADDVEGLSIEDIRELTGHQTRLVQTLGALYRKHGLQPRKYFLKSQNVGDGSSIAVE